MELIIEEWEWKYEDIDSWWDLKASCNYKLKQVLQGDNSEDFKIKLEKWKLEEIILKDFQMNNLKLFLNKQIE